MKKVKKSKRRITPEWIMALTGLITAITGIIGLLIK